MRNVSARTIDKTIDSPLDMFIVLFPNSSLGCHPCYLLLIKIELEYFCGLETKSYALIKL